MDLWQNFPEPTYVRDGLGRLVRVQASPDTDALCPRLDPDRDRPDRLVMFGDMYRMGDRSFGFYEDGEEAIRVLLDSQINRAALEAAFSFVASGKLTDHALVDSPFGPHPLLVAYEGLGYTWKVPEDESVAQCVRDLMAAGRAAPSIDPAAEDRAVEAALLAGPMDGLALVECPWPSGAYLLVDETDPDCAAEVKATSDPWLLAVLCLNAIGREPADAARLLEELGTLLRAVAYRERGGMGFVEPCDLDGPFDGLQWVHKGGVDVAQGESWVDAATRRLDSVLSELNAWLQGSVWTCEAREVFGDGEEDRLSGIIVTEDKDAATVCLSAMGLTDASAAGAPDLSDPVGCAAAEVASRAAAEGRTAGPDEVVSLVISDDALWDLWVGFAVEHDREVIEAVYRCLERVVRESMGPRA